MKQKTKQALADVPLLETPANACPWSSLLLLTDGEKHSEKAAAWAFYMSMNQAAELTVMHVVDPYLKQFYNEIYSQGRKEYLEHVDRELKLHAEKTVDHIKSLAASMAVEPKILCEYGDPLKKISEEIKKNSYDLIITGGKKLSGIAAYKSWDLPSRLASKVTGISIHIVRS